MTTLILGLVIFLGGHSLRIVSPGLRDSLLERLGENGYKGVYSLISLAGFVLIVMGYSAARSAGSPDIWYPPVWTRHVSYLIMLPVFVLLIAAYFPGRIQAAAKHPMLVAIKVWALAHLLSNGDLATMLVAVGFLAWAVVDRISVKRRTAPSGAPQLPASGANDIIAIVGGLALYVAFVLWLHTTLIGVPIWPM